MSAPDQPPRCLPMAAPAPPVPPVNDQVVQQLILGAAAAAMTAHIELVSDVPLLADDD